MRLLLNCILVFFTSFAYAEGTKTNEPTTTSFEQVNVDAPEINDPYFTERFYTHITTQARTLRPGHVAFETFPGGNVYTSFLTNSLSVGVFNRLQFGTAPAFYMISDHQYNFNFKTNIIKRRYFQLGFGISHFRFEIDSPSSPTIDGANLDLNFVYVAANYRTPGSKFAFGYNFSYGETASSSNVIDDALEAEFKRRTEWAFDTSYELSKIWIMTFGVGEQREEIFEIKSERLLGLGLSFTYLQPTVWFPRLTYGFHVAPSNGKTTFLLSFDI